MSKVTYDTMAFRDVYSLPKLSKVTYDTMAFRDIEAMNIGFAYDDSLHKKTVGKSLVKLLALCG